MNLEDRLRSHMHSGDDLFVETGRDAEVITTAGRRRTRRNQVGGGLAGGALALALVVGVASSFGSEDAPEEFAAEELATEDLATDLAEASQDTAMAESILAEDPGASESFEGPLPPFEVVTGVDDGFAGLRSTNGVVTAIRSDDGITWTESPTTGISTGLVRNLIHADGAFAAIFTGSERGAERSFIGTSNDLVSWTLVEVVREAQDTFVSGLAIRDGQLVTTAQSFERAEDEVDPGSAVVAVTGPVGGPYLEFPLPVEPFGVDRIVPTNTGFVMTGFVDGLSQTLSSVDGEVWTLADTAPSERQYSTIASTDSALLSLVGAELGGPGELTVRSSVDGGFTWDEATLPDAITQATWWSFDIDTEGDVAGIVLQGPGAEELTTAYGLVVTTGGPWESIDLSPYVEPGATAALAAVSTDEVIVQVFPPPAGELDEDLAASSGVVDEPGLPTTQIQYVRIPLP